MSHLHPDRLARRAAGVERSLNARERALDALAAGEADELRAQLAAARGRLAAARRELWDAGVEGVPCPGCGRVGRGPERIQGMTDREKRVAVLKILGRTPEGVDRLYRSHFGEGGPT